MNRSSVGTLLLVLSALACGDGDPIAVGGGGGGAEDHVVVLNSTALTLSVLPTDGEGAARTIDLAPSGSPVSLAVRGGTALVPLGTFPGVAVVDLETGTSSIIGLPAGSGATGVVILDDSLALVANPDLNTVSPVLYDRGARLPDIPVGLYPQGFVSAGGRVFVINGRLQNFVPVGPGNATVLDASTLAVLDSIQFTGVNPGDALASGGTLYVLHQGSFGAGDGSLSRISLATLAEAGHETGFGEFPGKLALADDGSLLVGAFAYGIARWSPTAGFVIPPAQGVRPVPTAAVSDVAVGPDGRIFALDAGDCTAPGTLFWLDDALGVLDQTEVGACPIAIAFGRF